jgi:GntR family transcriptional regulator
MLFPKSGVPLYLQLYEQLKSKIVSGEWRTETPVPPESLLVRQLGVSRETVRRAILRLVSEGYLYRRQGRGTFVCRQRPEDGLEQLISFTAEIVARGYRPGAKVLALENRQPGPQVAAILDTHEPVIYFKRLRTAGDIPVAVEESYLRPDVFGDLDPAKLGGSFYQYLVYDKGLKPGRIVQEISSAAADPSIAELLELQPGHPILRFTRLIHDLSGVPFFWMVFACRGDVYTVKTRLEP